MKNPNPLEKDIESKVCEHAKKLGILCYKFTSPSRRSVPDRIFFLPDGRVFLIEFKRAGQHPTPAQAVEIEKLKQQQMSVYVVDNVEGGKRIVGIEFNGLGPEDLLKDY
jgi:hypothetical protein